MTAIDWISTRECAEEMGVHPRHVRRLANEGKLHAIRAADRREGLLIAVQSLPSNVAARLAKRSANATAEPTKSDEAKFNAAPVAARRRATYRLEVVQSYRIAVRDALEQGARLGIAEQAWHKRFCAETGFGGSLKSVRRWAARYARKGISGLVDHNDGSARRGKYAIPVDALNFFREVYLDKERPSMTVAAAIRETRLCAEERGWQLPDADDGFYRYARKIPKVIRLARKDAVDARATIEPFVRREMDRPGRTYMCDHHLVDVFVSCEGAVCAGGRCTRAHRPWWTPILDVGSRRILSHRLSLDPPNSHRILAALRAAIESVGLPERFYVDNGKDFKKATGKGRAFDPAEQTFLDSRFAALGVKVVWAIPYNAQAKAIERLFGTFITVVWQTFESYVGRLGRRSEHADHLYRHPELCPTFTEFSERLDAEVTLYNSRPHRGVGMRKRTPDDVFAAEHLPMRKADRAALALVFWRCAERVLDRNGLRLDNIVYQLEDPSAQVRYQGERLKLLIDPDDISHAVVCTQGEDFLCEARAERIATHDTRDAVTQEVLEVVGARRKALRRAAAAGDVRAQMLARNWKSVLHKQLVREAARRREMQGELAAAVGESAASTVVLPRYSKIARELENPDPLSFAAAGGGWATTVPEIPDERLDALLRESAAEPFAPNLIAAGGGEFDLSGEELEAERRRVRRLIKRERLECLTPSCERRAEHEDPQENDEPGSRHLCTRCFVAKYGTELDPALLEELCRRLEETE